MDVIKTIPQETKRPQFSVGETLRYNWAVFVLNACWKVASDFTLGDNNPFHRWSKRKVKESVKTLIPAALAGFRAEHADIANDPNVRYTIFPKQQGKIVDVLALGEVGFSLAGAFTHLEVPLGLSDCVFRADSQGNILEDSEDE